LRSWLRTRTRSQSRVSKDCRSRRTGKSPRRPQLEILEDRLVPTVHAWTGALSNLWSNGGNWTNGVPSAADSNLQLQFPPGAQHTSNVNDILNLSPQSILLSGTGYVLDGAPVVTLDANAVVTNTGSNNQIKFKIDLSAAPNLFDATHTFNVATNTTLT